MGCQRGGSSATCAKSEMPTVMVSPSSFAHSCDFAYFSPSSTAQRSVVSWIYRSAFDSMIAWTGDKAGTKGPPVAYDRQTAIQPAVATRDSPQRMLGSTAILNPHLRSG